MPTMKLCFTNSSRTNGYSTATTSSRPTQVLQSRRTAFNTQSRTPNFMNVTKINKAPTGCGCGKR